MEKKYFILLIFIASNIFFILFGNNINNFQKLLILFIFIVLFVLSLIEKSTGDRVSISLLHPIELREDRFCNDGKIFEIIRIIKYCKYIYIFAREISDKKEVKIFYLTSKNKKVLSELEKTRLFKFN